MTSQVNPNNIDGTYPVAGQDNDSQGFRDNFTNIRNNLTYVKAEIEDIQNKAIFKTALTNTTLDNDFYGNIIANPSFTGWRETYNNIGAVSGATTINFANGNFQKITMSGSTTLTFSWPSNTANQYASIKLWVSNPNASYTLTLPSSVTLGDPDTVAGLNGTSPPIISFNSAQIANNTEYLFEFFTLDGGTTLGIKDLIRNRDVDLTGLSITGNLSLDNITSSGNVTTTNGIFWAGNGNPFSPPASGSFTGNVTSTVDFVATGNVWAQGGHFRTSASTVYLANTTPTTGYLLGGATQIYVGGTGGTSTFAGVIKANGNIVASATTASTSSTTGALVVAGGAGIAGVAVVGGNLVAAATTTSTSSTTGALVVAGGAGIAGALNVGSTVSLAAGSTTIAPLSFSTTSSTLLTTASRGAVEYDSTANIFYATPTASTVSSRAILPTRHEFVLGSNINLNGGGTIAVVNTGYGAFGNLNVTVAATTTYEVDIRIHIGFAAAPTSSTLQFTFGGTATMSSYNYDVTVINAASGTVSTASSLSNWFGTTTFPTATAGVVSAAQTLPNVLLRVRGIVRTNAQGTLIPQLAWGTLPAQTAQVVTGSYIALTPLGNTTGNVSVGNFTLV